MFTPPLGYPMFTFAVAALLTLAATTAAVARPTGSTITVELTGYSHHDNQGGDNARICCGVIHRQAGGTGTYSDPITVAVPGSRGRLETPAGTRAYIRAIHKYVIVEDSGASKVRERRHFDVYVDGEGLSVLASERCMDRITGTVTAVMNPPRGLLVHSGRITTASGCNL